MRGYGCRRRRGWWAGLAAAVAVAVAGCGPSDERDVAESPARSDAESTAESESEPHAGSGEQEPTEAGSPDGDDSDEVPRFQPDEPDGDSGSAALGPENYPPPVPGAHIDDDGFEGAESTAVYFLELYYYMEATGDTREFDRLAADGCQFCAERREYAVAFHEPGDVYLEAELPQFHNASLLYGPDGSVTMELTLTEPAVRVYNLDGEMFQQLPERKRMAHVAIEKVEVGWLVREAEFVG